MQVGSLGDSNPQDGSVHASADEDRCDCERSFAPASYKELAAWCLTGMSGWWALNAIVAELPHFVAVLPEGALLGNLIAVCTQLGNVAPMIYKNIYSQAHGRLTHVIAVFQGLATITLIACAHGWNTQVGGHSMVLLMCVALAGCVGCMSSVTYWAVAASRPASCTKAMSIGMTIGGLFTVALSAAQCAGRDVHELRFSPLVFFYIAAAAQVIQGAAFCVQMFSESARGSDSRRPSASPSLASCFSADSGAGSFGADQLVADHAQQLVASQRKGLPLSAKALLLGVFLLYAATYTMPSMWPFVATSYAGASEQQQLLLMMLVLQNVGEIMGRLSTACTHGNTCWTVVFALFLSGAFIGGVTFAASTDLTTSLWDYHSALVALPALCGIYYFSRGVLVTTMYLNARSLGDIGFATKLSLHMGVWGQIGALMATAITFVLMCGLRVFS